MAEQSSKASTTVYILSCSGPSGLGQTAHRAAVELTREGLGQMLNLAGIAGHRGTFLDSARELGPGMVVLDGCPVACAKSVVDHLGIHGYTHLTLTDLGIPKSEELDPSKGDVEKVKSAFQHIHARLEAGLPGALPKCLCAEEW